MRFWFNCIAKVTYFTVFHLLASPSVEITRGVFLSPKHSTEKFFRKFFQITPSDFLLIFWREFVMRGTAACPLPMGGGTPFLWACGLLVPIPFLFPFLCSGSLPCCLALWASVPDWLTASGGPPALGPALIPSGAAGPPATGRKVAAIPFFRSLPLWTMGAPRTAQKWLK